MLNNSKGKKNRRRKKKRRRRRDRDRGRKKEGKGEGEEGKEEERKREGWRPVNAINLESKLPVWVSTLGMECVRQRSLRSLVLPE